MVICKIDGCENKIDRKGLCCSHYNKEYNQTAKRKAYNKMHHALKKSKISRSEYEKTDKGKEVRKRITKKYGESEGFGVYQATSNSGSYIGSGLIAKRRSQHLSGNSTIFKSLNEKAASFEVLIKCHKSKCKELEQKLIAWVRLENLLNKRMVGG